MFIAIMALIIASMPNEASAQERRAKEAQELRIKKHPRKQRHAPRAMRDKDFSMMYDIVKKTSFDDRKIDIIRVACIGSRFDSKQCARLLSLLSFDDNKLKALEVIAPRLTEMENFDKILKEFSFASNKDEAVKILAQRKQ